MSLQKLITLALLATAGAIAPGGARADTTTCTEITSLPANLTVQGVYCLNASLVSSSADPTQIWISANNVTLDCNGHTVRDGAGNYYGVRSTAYNNATIRNCVFDGFKHAVDLHGDGHLVEDNLVWRSSRIGIKIIGNAGMIRRNRVLGIGNQAIATAPIGIRTTNVIDILDNTVEGVAAGAGTGMNAYGIEIVGGEGVEVAGNHVSGTRGDGAGYAIGISIGQSPRGVLRDNIVIGEGSGFGLKSSSAPEAYVTGNLVLGFATGVTGLIVGDNVIQ